MQQTIRNLAVLIDADNVSAAHAGFIFATARKLGDPVVRRAYGMVNCFSQEKGWWNAQREYGIVVRPRRSVWYDKDELEALSPTDGLLKADVSAGKAYRRETVLTVAADLRSGRARCADIGGLKTLLKRGYAVPNPDIESVIATLCSQKVVKLDKSGKITVLQAN